MVELTKEDKLLLQKLNSDKRTTEALKKLFLNVVLETTPGPDAEIRAAERTAMEFIKRAFHDLKVMKPEEIGGRDKVNPI